MATSSASACAAKALVRVKLCSAVPQLRSHVERAFAASDLATRHTLILEELSEEAGPPWEAKVLLADPGKVAPFIDQIEGLKWMQCTWAGVNTLSGSQRRDYTCTRLGGCMGLQMSEYVLGAIFADDWRYMQKRQEAGEWDQEPLKKRPRLSTLTLGCLGVGDIPSVVASRAQAFGMKTVGLGTTVRDVQGFDTVTTDLPQVLRQSDIIVNVLPSTARTRGLLDGGALQACGSGKLFINVGRGDVVSEGDLVDALDKGWLRGAVLDVFTKEPLPATSAFWKHPLVRVTPHIAAVTHPEDTAELFVKNLALWLESKPLLYKVDLDQGY